jgi:hypothetical protein
MLRRHCEAAGCVQSRQDHFWVGKGASFRGPARCGTYRRKPFRNQVSASAVISGFPGVPFDAGTMVIQTLGNMVTGWGYRK